MSNNKRYDSKESEEEIARYVSLMNHTKAVKAAWEEALQRARHPQPPIPSSHPALIPPPHPLLTEKIPCEIRALILNHLLVPHSSSHLLSDPVKWQDKNRALDPYPHPRRGLVTVQILRVSKLLHAEGTSLLYGMNVLDISRGFEWHSNSVFWDWLKGIGEVNGGLIRHVSLRYDQVLRHIAFSGLRWIFLRNYRLAQPITLQEKPGIFSNGLTSIQLRTFSDDFDGAYGWYPVRRSVGERHIFRNCADPVLKHIYRDKTEEECSAELRRVMGDEGLGMTFEVLMVNIVELLKNLCSGKRAEEQNVEPRLFVQQNVKSWGREMLVTKQKNVTAGWSPARWKEIVLAEIKYRLEEKERTFTQNLEKERATVDDINPNIVVNDDIEELKRCRMGYGMQVERPEWLIGVDVGLFGQGIPDGPES
ncbi:MAG: hypothetical protein Q9227_000598 [Pyrenula ochraceoflavens]